MERIRIDASRCYEVIIGGGVLSRLGEMASSLVKGRKCAVVADDTTRDLFFDEVHRLLSEAGFSVCDFVIPHGEESKSAESYVNLLEFLAEQGLTRADCMVALGGGVVGDLTGFAASSFLRGISFIQVPTTLLSAVDSSVGGKTAINLRAGKNLAGAFYQPSLVLCDTDIIRELPEEIFSEGMAEVIKYGAIGSEKVLDMCLDGAHENLDALIAECVRMKRDIVAQDEFDLGLRQLLNLGHTPAHSIEKLSGFEISHGRAVAIGMCLMAIAGERLSSAAADFDGELPDFTPGFAAEISELCRKYALPTECPYTARELATYAMSDKKRSANEITLVLPVMRGKSELVRYTVDEVEGVFENGLKKDGIV
ncbi:MAG: 3-dehydroquinate synthase [Oscillospiraceae bacterium]|nr:3-dehydroquinate synthase [Oscillospiraceae bacterium]